MDIFTCKPPNRADGGFFRQFLMLAWITFAPAFVAAQQPTEDEENFIVPVRPSVSESARIQKKGVLQIETGADFDFDSPDFRNGQTAPLGVYYAVNKRLRLDFEFETIASQKNRMENERETGIGDVNLGFKFVARDQPKERLAAAFSYSVKLPTADENKSLGTGRVDHNLRLIFNRTYGKNDFIVNVSYLNVGRAQSDKRASGAQVILRYDRELTKKFGVITEYFGNTVDEDQPRGLYILGALTYQPNKRLRFDVGARPGFGRNAPNFNFFFGLSFGAADFSAND